MIFVVVVAGTNVAHVAQRDHDQVMRAVCPAGRDVSLDLAPASTATDLAWCPDCHAYFDYVRGEIERRAKAASNGRRR